jgi:hypothetical protein
MAGSCEDINEPSNGRRPVTVGEQSKTCTVFARSEAKIVGSNPTQGMDDWYVYVFIVCLCCPVFRQRPCDELITRPRSPTVCKMIKMEKQPRHRKGIRGTD